MPVSQPRNEVAEDRGYLSPVGRQHPSRLAQRQGQAADLRVTHGPLPTGLPRLSTSHQLRQGGDSELSPGEATVSIAPIPQKRLETVGLPGVGGGGQLIPRAQQDAQGLSVPSARGVGNLSASRPSANSTARCASIGSDFPLPRRALRLGCSASITRTPAALAARASPTP